ncbi:MAG: hypothetical protein QOF78_3077 [Phycisphaerales bacterium]|jgi:heme/copper-type cytochrome/quinol oxidase subunit 2|nr:hypothetical protein [Phycisphaerales bacterium]
MTSSPAGSKAQRSNPKNQKGKTEAGAGVTKATGPLREPIPWKPHKGLFVTLMTVFVVWVGVMLAMYFMTVRPRLHSAPQSPPATTAPALAGQPALE